LPGAGKATWSIPPGRVLAAQRAGLISHDQRRACLSSRISYNILTLLYRIYPSQPRYDGGMRDMLETWIGIYGVPAFIEIALISLMFAIASIRETSA
jgi:hypothetical protein